MSESICDSIENPNTKGDQMFKDLMRRVDLTRRARIKASNRLRKKHEFYEKISYGYSLIILILSIWFIEGSGDVIKILLIASLSLAFFTMFLGVKNYKERASNFENNYQQLNILWNKLQRLKEYSDGVDEDKIKEVHREYERLLLDKENHLDIDYQTCKPEHEEKYKMEIIRHSVWETLKRCLVAIVPLILMVYFVWKN